MNENAYKELLEIVTKVLNDFIQNELLKRVDEKLNEQKLQKEQDLKFPLTALAKKEGVSEKVRNMIFAYEQKIRKQDPNYCYKSIKRKKVSKNDQIELFKPTKFSWKKFPEAKKLLIEGNHKELLERYKPYGMTRRKMSDKAKDMGYSFRLGQPLKKKA